MTDLKLAIRGLRRRPTFAVTGMALLALGIGAATLVFAIVDSILLRPLPYMQPDELAAVFTVERDGAERRNPTSPANFVDLREGLSSFESLTAARVWNPTITGDGQPERIDGILSTPELFDMLGASALIGRTWDARTDADAAVAVIGYGLWNRRFGGDHDVIGRTILLDGEAHTIVGVMPDGFRFPPFWATSAELWAPLRMGPQEWSSRGASYLRIFGRLRADADIARAGAEATAIARRLAAAYPETNADVGFNVESLREPSVADSRTALLALAGAVGLLLLIACANLANLLLGRVLETRRDTAVKVALGAGRGRLWREWFAEAMVLAAAGSSLGLLVAVWSLQGLLRLSGAALPAFRTIVIDARVAGFAFVAGIAVSLCSGLLPAIRAVRADVFDGLRSRSAVSERSGRARGFLAGGEVALATMLLIGAALLGRSFMNLTRVEPGFDREDVLTASFAFGNGRYSDAETQGLLFQDILQRARAAPGTRSAGIINHLPIGGDLWRTRFAPVGDPPRPDAELPGASYRVADAAYFETMRIPLLSGRAFATSDGAGSVPVALVNQSLADRYFGGDPVGRRIRFGGDSEEAPVLEIIGVVGDVRQASVAEPVLPEVYLPYGQNPDPWFPFATLVIRSDDPVAMARTIVEQVAAVDASLPVFDVRPLDQVLSDALRAQRLNSLLTALFAAAALLLSVVGVYAVIAQLTRQKTHEVAVRLALGADPGSVLGMIVRRGVQLAIAGSAAGVLASTVMARPVSSLFFGVTALDAPTLVGVAFLMTLVCAGASAVPALRAARTSPVAALKQD